MSARIAAIFFVTGARVALAAVGPTGVWPDSARYREGVGTNVFRFDLGQGPGQLLQVINLLPVGPALVLQTLLAALLWGWAAHVATKGLHQAWFWLMLLFSLSPWWLVWDWSVLTEALTLASMALFAAGAARWLNREPAGPMLVGAALALLTRPLVVPLVVGMLAVVLVARRSLPRPRWALGALVVLVAFAGVQAVTWNRAVATYDYLPRPLTLSAIQASDRVAARSGVPGYLELAKTFGMPDCPEIQTLPYGFEGSYVLRASTCPGMQEWIDGGGLPWWAELVSNPTSTAAELLGGRWHETTWAGYDSGFWLTPARALPVDAVMWGILGLAAAALLMQPGRGWPARQAVVVGAAGYALILLMVDGMENWRHMLPALVVAVPFAVGCYFRPRRAVSA